jgi:hypothetical protein
MMSVAPLWPGDCRDYHSQGFGATLLSAAQYNFVLEKIARDFAIVIGLKLLRPIQLV